MRRVEQSPSRARACVALVAICAAQLIALAGTGCGARGPSSTTVSLARLAERDELEAPGDPQRGNVGVRRITAWAWAQLDGKGAREVIVRVDELAAPDLLRLHYYAYDISNSRDPKLLGGPLSIDEARDPGFMRIVDLDGDRRQELLLVGDTDGTSISELRVYTWRAGFQDTVWGEDEGAGYVTFDYDRDGVQEILALSPAEDDADDVSVQVLDLVSGTWRPTAPRRPLTSWAPDAFQALLEDSPIERPEHELHLMTRVMIGLGLEPPRPDDAHRALRARFDHARDPAQRAAILRAMYWAKDAEAIALFRELLSPASDAPLSLSEGTIEVSSTAAHMLASVGSRTDRAWLLSSMQSVQASHPRGLADAYTASVVTGFTQVQDMRAVHEVLIALTARDLTTHLADMPLTHDAMGQPEHLRTLSEALSRSRDARAQRVILDWMTQAMRRARGSSVSVSRRDLLTFLNAPDVEVRVGAAHALGALAKTSSSRSATQDLLARLRIERDGPVREALLDALVDIPEAKPNTAMLNARFEQPMSAEERTSVHRLVARVDEPLAWVTALEHVERGADVTPYIEGLELHARGPRDGRWRILAASVTALTTHANNSVRLASCALMSQLDTPTTRQATAERASLDPDATVRTACIRTLGEISAREHTGMLLELAAQMAPDDDEDIRHVTYDALGMLWSEQVREAFMTSLASDPDPATSMAILDALIPRHADVLADRDLRKVVRDHARQRIETAETCEPVIDLIERVFAIGLNSAPLILVRTEFVKACNGRSEDLTIAALDALAEHPRQNLRGFVRRWRDFPKRPVRRAAARADAAYDAER